MNCDAHALSAYVDGELGFVEARELKAHAEVCAACRRKLRTLAALKAAVHRIEILPLPEDLKQRLMRLVARRRWALGLAAATVSAFLVIGLGSRRPRVPIETLLAAHGEYAMTLPLAPRERIDCDLADQVALREPIHEF